MRMIKSKEHVFNLHRVLTSEALKIGKCSKTREKTLINMQLNCFAQTVFYTLTSCR